jgi:hypothetical protein
MPESSFSIDNDLTGLAIPCLLVAALGHQN